MQSVFFNHEMHLCYHLYKWNDTFEQHHGHDAYDNEPHRIITACLRPSIALQVQNRGLKHQSFTWCNNTLQSGVHVY